MLRLILVWCAGVIAGAALMIGFSERRCNSCENAEQSEQMATLQAAVRESDYSRYQALDRTIAEGQADNSHLRAEIARLSAYVPTESEAPPAHVSDAGSDWFDAEWSELMQLETDDAARENALVASGFPAQRADWLLTRLSQLQMTAAEELSASGGSGDVARPVDYLDARLAARQALRQEIGDAEYERYLRGTGQATEIGVAQINPDSPARFAGMQIGDAIVGYDGNRVFNAIDLAEQAGTGNPGEPVLIDIVRDGAPMQIVVPRGPLGIAGGW